MNKYVPAMGAIGAKLAVVGSAPSYEEVDAGKPFVGANGRELDRLLKEAGVSRSELWFTNISKFFVPPQPFGEKKQKFEIRAAKENIDLQEQVEHLYKELNEVNPNCLLILGGDALRLATGHWQNLGNEGARLVGAKNKIQDYRGSIISALGHKAVSTFQPAHLIHQAKGEIQSYWERKVMIFDIQRAYAQSKFKEINLPSRYLHICHSSTELLEFKERYKNRKKPAIDIEAHPNGSCIPICIGISYDKKEGITVPLWNIDNISTIPDGDLASIWRILAEILYCEEGVVGQNLCGYDRDKMKRLGFIIKKLASDTMFKAFCINPELPKNLAFLTSIYTEEPFYKNEGMYEGSVQDLLIGCARDACVTKEIDEVEDSEIDELGTRDFYEQFMIPLAELYMEIENEGMDRDKTIHEELIKKYVEWDEKINYELFKLSGNQTINTGSWQQVDKLLYTTWGIPRRKGTSEEVLTGLLNNVVKDPAKRRGIELILEDRRVKKTLNTYLLSPADFDGRMRTSFFLCLDTGRTSTNQQEPPIRPSYSLRKENRQKKDTYLGAAFQTLTKHGDIGPDIRKQYVADPGYIFIQLDSSQAEARVVFKLANDEEALKLVDTIDYHAFTASWFFGGTEDDYSKKILGYEHPIRFAGKAQPLDSKILTPTGWKLMGEIKIGDEICNSMYEVSQVTGVFPQGVKEVFKIKLSDGSEAESCKEHLWQIQSSWDRQRGIVSIKKLEDIMRLELKNTRGNPKYSIQRQNAMRFNWQPVPINPYILGVMLGDGSFRTPYGCSFFTDDEEILQQFLLEFGYDKLSQPNERTYYISELRPIINSLGLGNKYSHEKFIPEIYKINNLKNRLEILRGLLDTDGTINEFGSSIEYSTSSEQLANDVIFLVRSLGGIANMTNRIPKYEYKEEIREGKKSYRIFINIRQLNPFKLTRKAERWERWNSKTKYDLARNIISIEKTREVECQCISVNSEDHLYVTDDFILTHNTLRHAGHLGAGKTRACIEVNTQCRKYGIDFKIRELDAEKALNIFHTKQPKIKQVYHASVIKCLEKSRQLKSPVPYGINAKVGGIRTFFERWGDELFRQGFSYLPQRTVSENTKGAALRIKQRAGWIRIAMESHDALLLHVPISRKYDAAMIGSEEMQRPIDFKTCCIERDTLVIPCDVEESYDYFGFKKFKFQEVLVNL